jgi:hypothetical protein
VVREGGVEDLVVCVCVCVCVACGVPFACDRGCALSRVRVGVQRLVCHATVLACVLNAAELEAANMAQKVTWSPMRTRVTLFVKARVRECRWWGMCASRSRER